MQPLHFQHLSEKISLFRPGSGTPLLVQNARQDKRPYIHPIVAPDGDGELTEDQPEHHLWQHGLYVGLNDVNGVGFWEEGLGKNRDTDGTFHPHPMEKPVNDGSSVRWRVATEWRSPTGASMLTETQQWRFEDQGEHYVLDMIWTLHARQHLQFGSSPYGGVFLRMPWRKETTGKLLTSEGIASQSEAEGQRARWVAVTMPIPGRQAGPAGIAMLDHPANAEHPIPWRVDNNLGIAPSRSIAGPWALDRGESTTSRYRFLVYIGEADPEYIDETWRAFSASRV